MSRVVPKPALSPRALEDLRAWLNTEMKSHSTHEILAVLAFVVVAVVGHIAAMLVALVFGADPDNIALSVLVPLIMLVGAYPYYFFWHKRKPAKAALSGGTARIPCNRLSVAKLFEGQRGLRIMDFLLFPVWAVDCIFMHLGLAMKARTADTWAMARVLGYLYAEDRRVTAHDLDMMLTEPGLPGAIEALQVLPGVLYHTDDGLALSLNSEMCEKVAEVAGR